MQKVQQVQNLKNNLTTYKIQNLNIFLTDSWPYIFQYIPNSLQTSGKKKNKNEIVNIVGFQHHRMVMPHKHECIHPQNIL